MVNLALEGELSLDPVPLFLFGGFWVDVLSGKEVHQLAWNFSEHLSRKHHGVVLEIYERNELNDVPGHLPLVLLGVQRRLICIQSVHR